MTAVSLAVVLWYSADYLKDFFFSQKKQDLEVRARLAGLSVADAMEGNAPAAREEEVNRLCLLIGRESSTRITVVLPGGRVIGDSEEDPSVMDNHSDRPEMRKAFEGRTGVSLRYSATVGKDLMYVAIPLGGDPSRGVVRASLPLSTLESIPFAAQARFAVAGAAVLLLAAGFGFVITRRVVRPLEELREGAEQFREGNLSLRLPSSRWEEFGGLADEMNSMAAQLEERISAESRQRNEMETVLESMTEGLIAVNDGEEIININKSAAAMLDIEPEGARGRSVREVVRNASLQDFLSDTLSNEAPGEGEIVLYGPGERYFQVHGAKLNDARGACKGAMVVLNDITELRRLDKIKSDFVANASHEIRTPVTTIKGFVETLRDGAIKDPEKAARFLEHMGVHADRLNAIVEDLLSLSRIEGEDEGRERRLSEMSLDPIIEEAVDLCRPRAREKDIALDVDCGSGISARVDDSLMVHALVNLLDNALKYSSRGKKVSIECRREGTGVSIRVKDQGMGIAGEHLPHLFGRFYRVDSARSRRLGGTGLGLAIVKHIVQVHGGTVTAESDLGKGSTFTIRLPLPS
jgi:two-component system phosphate regulon sensor histidine kinase PhoR